jgi:soluble lytic murein transglycosylase-like protein
MGAKGLMQLMPDTRSTYHKMLCVDTLKFDKNQEDIYIGLYYLKDLKEFWKKRGNPEKVLWKLSLAAYNAGPGKVIDYKGIPPYKQTIDFVNFINSSHSNPTFYTNILKKNIKKDVA